MIQRHYKAVCEKHGEENVFCVFLYGSQNYGIDTPNSDIDTKAVIFLSEEDAYWRHTVDYHICFDGGGLCEVMDLVTFVKKLLNYQITLLEFFITKHIIVNPQYNNLYEDLQHLDRELFDHNPKALIHQFYEEAHHDWEFFKYHFKDNREVKDFLHGYRKIMIAYKFYETRSYDGSLYLSPDEQELFKEIKLTKKIPDDLFIFYEDLESRVEEILNHMDCEPTLVKPFQVFCQKAYKQYNSN